MKSYNLEHFMLILYTDNWSHKLKGNGGLYASISATKTTLHQRRLVVNSPSVSEVSNDTSLLEETMLLLP